LAEDENIRIISAEETIVAASTRQSIFAGTVTLTERR
jgi:hypothetical protein